MNLSQLRALRLPNRDHNTAESPVLLLVWPAAVCSLSVSSPQGALWLLVAAGLLPPSAQEAVARLFHLEPQGVRTAAPSSWVSAECQKS